MNCCLPFTILLAFWLLVVRKLDGTSSYYMIEYLLMHNLTTRYSGAYRQ